MDGWHALKEGPEVFKSYGRQRTEKYLKQPNQPKKGACVTIGKDSRAPSQNKSADSNNSEPYWAQPSNALNNWSRAVQTRQKSSGNSPSQKLSEKSSGAKKHKSSSQSPDSNELPRVPH